MRSDSCGEEEKKQVVQKKKFSCSSISTETSAVPTETEMEDPSDFFLLWDKKVGPLYFYVHQSLECGHRGKEV